MTVDRDDFLLPVGTVTLLLADIEGSVRSWESHPDEMGDVLRRLDELVDETIARRNGVRPREQGAGDSFVAAFSRAADALSAALDLQLSLAKDELFLNKVAPRIGIHSGDVQRRDEGNYVGQTMNRCARLRDTAHGGQTVLSRSTYQLVVDALPDGAWLKDLGIHRLRDLARPEHVYQLCQQELLEDFPALRSLEFFPNNLPVELTTFVGRSAETDEVKNLLRELRMLTLTGSGGTGKTRLALQVAADLLDEFPDGVWWVDLSTVNVPDLVSKSLAEALSLREEPGRTFEQSIVSFLEDKQALCVFDNCEHVITACAQLAEMLLTKCRSVSVLTTSREPLGTRGETVWRVPSMTFPQDSQAIQIESLTQFEAVQLFIERAISRRADFQVTDENAPAIAEICHRLDGLPLAIELAAARVRVFTPQQICDGLKDRFGLLTGGARTLMPRQQTLQASVDWSYNLLSASERALLQRLAVFAGGCNFEAVEKVCSGGVIEPQQVLDLLSQLIEKSLVVVEEEMGAARYRLLETIRQYAMDRLAESGEAPSLRNSHRDYYSRKLSPFMPGTPPGIDPTVWTRSMTLEDGNFRSALEWSSQEKDYRALCLLSSGLTTLWLRTGRLNEGLNWLEKATSDAQEVPELIRATALTYFGGILWQAGYIARMEEPLRESLGIFRKLDQPLGVMWALTQLSSWATFMAGRDEATRYLDEVGDLASKLGLLAQQAQNLNAHGYLRFVKGPITEAPQFLEQSEALFEKVESTLEMELSPRLWWGVARFVLGELDEAETVLREFLASQTQPWPTTHYFLAQVLLAKGKYEEARFHAQQSLEISGTDMQVMWSEGFGLLCYGQVEFALGNLDRAQTLLEEAGQIERPTGVPLIQAMFLLSLVRILLVRGEVRAARKRLNDGLSELKQGKGFESDALGPVASQNAAFIEALLSKADGNWLKAEESGHEALVYAEAYGAPYSVATSLELLASLAAAQTSYAEAARLWGAADQFLKTAGYARWPVEVEEFEREVEAARQTFGDEAFAQAWQEGQQMSLTEAAAYARRGRGERKRPSKGWPSLTPTELQIVDLVAEGLTNPQIGERMFISRKTVQGHLGRIFAKLGVATRSELAAEATRRAVSSSQ